MGLLGEASMSTQAHLLQSMAIAGYNRPLSPGQALAKAIRLYQRSRLVGRLKGLLARLTGSSRALLDLRAAQAIAAEHNSHFLGRVEIPVVLIRGSEGRTRDFDADFHPLSLHNRERWLSVAAAWLQGTVLPPIDLVQVGDVFYVRDGHHRVSVARAMGREYIDALVTA
jgi:hypothetical protein